MSLSKTDLFVPIKIDENDLYTGVLELLAHIRPNWIQENVKLKTLTDGITNKLVSCQYGDLVGDKEILLVRIYGNKTDLFIDRTAEIRNIKRLNVLGMAPQIYATFENGLAYQYYPGKTLDTSSVIHETIWPLVATQMARMHKVELSKDVPKEPFIWNKIEKFLDLLPDPYTSEIKQTRFQNKFTSKESLKNEYALLKSHLSKSKSPIVFAHNDLLLGNVIYNEDERTISFIDYEYAAYCYQAFDIANHFNEFAGLSVEDIDYRRFPDEDFQIQWLKVYLATYMNTTEPCENHLRQLYTEVNQTTILSHFLWGVWALVQYEHSNIEFDFGRYAEIRLDRYFELRDNIFKQLS
ncbi:unnamed protein product [Chrysodeixis includens]|uniref:ethanolamine kinase n=1 Tax=Chrysodeixis includens TaxID=689277 RepID=A0A9P0BXP3_CHRIL|nr:unnamed protein product [Chrysodeixis includens]